MKTIDQDIKTGNFKPVYLLYGEERYLLRQYCARLKTALMGDGDAMNFTAFDSNNFSVEAVTDLAETMPFFAERRVILVQESGLFRRVSKADGANGSAGDSSSAEATSEGGVSEEAEASESTGASAVGSRKGQKGKSEAAGGAAAQLADYLGKIPETTCLIFVEESVDKRNRLYKAAAKYGSAVEFTRQKEATLSRWVVQRVKQEGKNITQGAYDLFISKTGTDMENIDRELEKLLCYTMDRDVITETDVKEITTEQLENRIFAMIDAAAEHRQAQALELYFDLLSLKEAPMKILYMLMRQFRILLVVRTMNDQGFSRKDIAEKVGCRDWAVSRYQQQCRGLSLQMIKQTLSDGADYEEAVKTGRLNDRMAVELLIVGICANESE